MAQVRNWATAGGRRASGKFPCQMRYRRVVATSGHGCKVAEEMRVLGTGLGRSSTQEPNMQLETAGDPFLLQAPSNRPPLKRLEHHTHCKGKPLAGNLFSSTEYILKDSFGAERQQRANCRRHFTSQSRWFSNVLALPNNPF